MRLADAQGKIEVYHEARPHSAPDWLTPTEVARQSGFTPALSNNQEPEILTSER
jgi:hypothetical protein